MLLIVVFEGKHPLINGAYYIERSSPSFDDKVAKLFLHKLPLFRLILICRTWRMVDTFWQNTDTSSRADLNQLAGHVKYSS